MPRSRSRNAPSPVLASDHDEMADDLHALADRGSRPARTWPDCVAESRRFEHWLAEHELDLDQVRHLADRDSYHLPKVPPALIAAYLHDTATAETKPKTLHNRTTSLLAWFKGTGWAVPDRRTSGGAGAFDIVTALVANHRVDDIDAHTRIPARPVTGDWIAGITAAIDAAGDDERIARLWIAAMRTFHLVTAWFGLRGGEAVTKLRWGWVDDRASELVIQLPGDRTLKYLDRPRTLRLPSPDSGPDCEHRDTCVIHQLRRWRELCDATGIPTGPGDLVFPAIRRMPHTSSTPNAEAFWRNRSWVADPVGETVRSADADALATLTLHAERTHYKRYARFWKQFALAAGFTPRHRFEKVSTHSNRRGTATRLHANGAALQVIAHQLCHEGLATTPRYIDPTDLPVLDPRPLYDRVPVPPIGPERPRVADHLADYPPGESPPGRAATSCELDVDDARCDAPVDGCVELDGVMTAVCKLHRSRYLQGLRGAALAAPARHRPLPPICQVGTDISPCDRTPVAHILLDGSHLAACGPHYRRFRNGTTGDALHAPVQTPRAPHCQVPDGAGPCQRPPSKGVVADGVHTTMCATHARRFDAGKRGDALTAGVTVRRLAERCEVVHHDVPCGRDARTPQGCFITVDGITLTACDAHHQRYRSGKRGDALTGPIRNRLVPSCELVHDDTVCGRPTSGRVSVDGAVLSACHSHIQRYRRGKRGDALTGPIRAPAPPPLPDSTCART